MLPSDEDDDTHEEAVPRLFLGSLLDVMIKSAGPSLGKEQRETYSDRGAIEKPYVQLKRQQPSSRFGVTFLRGVVNRVHNW